MMVRDLEPSLSVALSCWIYICTQAPEDDSMSICEDQGHLKESSAIARKHIFELIWSCRDPDLIRRNFQHGCAIVLTRLLLCPTYTDFKSCLRRILFQRNTINTLNAQICPDLSIHRVEFRTKASQRLCSPSLEFLLFMQDNSL